MILVRLFFLIGACRAGCIETALLNSVNDIQLTASSTWSSAYPESRSRLHTKWTKSGSMNLYGGWCALYQTKAQWIQVDFEKPERVSAVATQGEDSPFFEWMTSYTIEYSNDGRSWTTYTENGSKKILTGNADRHTVKKNQLAKPFTARSVRLNPQSWHNYICLRWQLFGCNPPDAHCPSGFGHHYASGTPDQMNGGVQSFQPSCYIFLREQKNWLQARQKCQSIGGDLVSVETAGEQQHLVSVIESSPALQTPRFTNPQHDFGYWTSGTDASQEGKWRWAATGRELTFTKWSVGQPDNNHAASGAAENCLQLRKEWFYNWNDEACSNVYSFFICETRGHGAGNQ